MGFSGGGANILKAHTHDSTILQDGGSLDFGNVTQGSMSAGSLTQSDGVHLQELLIGNPAEIPRVNGAGNAVEWHSPVDLTGSMELLDSETLVATGTDVAVAGTWAMTDYSYFIIKGGFSKNTAGAASMLFRINTGATAVYVTNMILNTAGTLSATTSGMQTSSEICTNNVVNPASNETYQMVMTLELSEQGGTPSSGYRWNWSTTPMWDQGGAAPSDTEQITGIYNNNSQNVLNNLQFYFSDGGDFNIGSNIQLYGVKRT